MALITTCDETPPGVPKAWAHQLSQTGNAKARTKRRCDTTRTHTLFATLQFGFCAGSFKTGVFSKRRTMVTQLIQHERIKTTVPKAKEVSRMAEKMVTLAKRGERSQSERGIHNAPALEAPVIYIPVECVGRHTHESATSAWLRARQR